MALDLAALRLDFALAGFHGLPCETSSESSLMMKHQGTHEEDVFNHTIKQIRKRLSKQSAAESAARCQNDVKKQNSHEQIFHSQCRVLL